MYKTVLYIWIIMFFTRVIAEVMDKNNVSPACTACRKRGVPSDFRGNIRSIFKAKH